MTVHSLPIYDLGLCDYNDALGFQSAVFNQVKSGLLQACLIFCRHNPVITIGRSAKGQRYRQSQEYIAATGINIVHAGRGGDITYHGPGQQIIYPIVDLTLIEKDIHAYLRKLEEICLASFKTLGLTAAGTHQGHTGIWLEGKKLASIGIGVKNWITFHGVAVNVREDDLDPFSYIYPCGMDIQVGCLDRALGRQVGFTELTKEITCEFKNWLKNSEEADYGAIACSRAR